MDSAAGHILILADFNLVVVLSIRQSPKLNSSPNFLAIRYYYDSVKLIQVGPNYCTCMLLK